MSASLNCPLLALLSLSRTHAHAQGHGTHFITINEAAAALARVANGARLDGRAGREVGGLDDIAELVHKLGRVRHNLPLVLAVVGLRRVCMAVVAGVSDGLEGDGVVNADILRVRVEPVLAVSAPVCRCEWLADPWPRLIALL